MGGTAVRVSLSSLNSLRLFRDFFVVLQENKENENKKMTLKDGSVKEYAQLMAVIDIARDLSNGLCMYGLCRRSEWRDRRSQDSD